MAAGHSFGHVARASLWIEYHLKNNDKLISSRVIYKEKDDFTDPNFASTEPRISVLEAFKEISAIIGLCVACVISEWQRWIICEIGGAFEAENFFGHTTIPLGFIRELTYSGFQVVDETSRAGNQQRDSNTTKVVLIAELGVRIQAVQSWAVAGT